MKELYRFRQFLAESVIKEAYNLPDSDSTTDKYVNNHWDGILKDEFEDGYEEFDDYNWKDILGPKHAFVQIFNQIPTRVEAVADYVMITVDLEDLKKLLN